MSGLELKSIEIAAKLIKERKTITNLSRALRQMCDDWGITNDRISAIVSDGGANIKGAIRQEFGANKHVECIAHQLNGVGQAAIGLREHQVPSMNENPVIPGNDELEDEDEDVDVPDEPETDNAGEFMKSLLKKVKKIVRFFRSNEVVTTLLKQLQEDSGVSPHMCLKLIQEVRTRWNSCYEMLERFLLLADFISSILLRLKLDRNSKTKAPNMLTGDEVEELTEARNKSWGFPLTENPNDLL